jgi:hypothetical protein
MGRITFYRGYSIPVAQSESFISILKKDGVRPYVNSRFQKDNLGPLPKRRREGLFRKDDLTTKDTRPESIPEVEFIFACGDWMGAAYYAALHNSGGGRRHAFVVEFAVETINRVQVDGRDFLYPLMQRGPSEKRLLAFEACYGKVIRKYVDKAWSSDQQDYRIAVCDLACEDPTVVRAHLSSSKVIRGRYQTTFCSSFVICSPIAPADIVAISEVKSLSLPDYDFSIDDLR